MRASVAKLLLNLYPPYLGTGIRVTRVSPDYREIDVEMPLRWYNRNLVGTHFGGNLASMTDPFFMLMLMEILGREYVVWDRASVLEFLRPGRGRVRARFRIPQSLVEEIRGATASGEKVLPTLSVDVVDEAGEPVARVTKTLHVRRRDSRRRSGGSSRRRAAA